MQRNQIWACPEEGTGVGQRGQRTTAGQLQAPGGQEEHCSSHILGQFASQLLILGDVEVRMEPVHRAVPGLLQIH